MTSVVPANTQRPLETLIPADALPAKRARTRAGWGHKARVCVESATAASTQACWAPRRARTARLATGPSRSTPRSTARWGATRARRKRTCPTQPGMPIGVPASIAQVPGKAVPSTVLGVHKAATFRITRRNAAIAVQGRMLMPGGSTHAKHARKGIMAGPTTMQPTAAAASTATGTSACPVRRAGSEGQTGLD